MLFTQPEFAVFMAAVLLGQACLPWNRARKLMLLGASYYFYAYWDWRFLGLLLFSTAADFSIGLALGRASGAASRRALLALSVTVNLGLLGTFKYLGFFVDSARQALAPLGIHLRTIEIILPVGISFYTFQALSYTIDVYRGTLQRCTSFLDFALFVAFFPQLVAGPIVRASSFLPQLSRAPARDWSDAYDGLARFVLGLFKKLFVADRLALFVDVVFAHPGAFSAGTTWLAVAAYALQIYCDFSGYSDMAIGLAKVLGYRLEENFDFPYLATSPSEFWRRWHISLSSWLRDYLYIPLGGNRRGARRTQINLMLTMLLGGLWHGAAWTFVCWGALHGVALSLWRAAGRLGLPAEPASHSGRLLGWAATLGVVLVAWVFFRSVSLPDAVLQLRRMASLSGGIAWYPPFPAAILALAALVHLARLAGLDLWHRMAADGWTAPLVLSTLIWAVVVYHPRGFRPFVYFQF